MKELIALNEERLPHFPFLVIAELIIGESLQMRLELLLKYIKGKQVIKTTLSCTMQIFERSRILKKEN